MGIRTLDSTLRRIKGTSPIPWIAFDSTEFRTNLDLNVGLVTLETWLIN